MVLSWVMGSSIRTVSDQLKDAKGWCSSTGLSQQMD
jgi:hypothetical protein